MPAVLFSDVHLEPLVSYTAKMKTINDKNSVTGTLQKGS